MSSRHAYLTVTPNAPGDGAGPGDSCGRPCEARRRAQTSRGCRKMHAPKLCEVRKAGRIDYLEVGDAENLARSIRLAAGGPAGRAFLESTRLIAKRSSHGSRVMNSQSTSLSFGPKAGVAGNELRDQGGRALGRGHHYKARKPRPKLVRRRAELPAVGQGRYDRVQSADTLEAGAAVRSGGGDTIVSEDRRALTGIDRGGLPFDRTGSCRRRHTRCAGIGRRTFQAAHPALHGHHWRAIADTLLSAVGWRDAPPHIIVLEQSDGGRSDRIPRSSASPGESLHRLSVLTENTGAVNTLHSPL